MREGVRVDLPPRAHELSHAERHEVPDLQIESAGEVPSAEDRQRVLPVAAISVVEAQHDRLVRQGRAGAPVARDRAQSDRMPTATRQPRNLRAQLVRRHVQVLVPRAPRAEPDHVVLENGDRGRVWSRVRGRRRAPEGKRASREKQERKRPRHAPNSTAAARSPSGDDRRPPRRRSSRRAQWWCLSVIAISVFAPFASAQPISTASFTLYFARIAADLSAGIAQVRPATVIDVPDSAEIVPRAELFSWVGSAGLQPLLPTSTAEPPSVPPPSLPFVNPVAGSKAAERFASRAVFDSCARPTARPAILPWS